MENRQKPIPEKNANTKQTPTTKKKQNPFQRATKPSVPIEKLATTSIDDLRAPLITPKPSPAASTDLSLVKPPPRSFVPVAKANMQHKELQKEIRRRLADGPPTDLPPPPSEAQQSVPAAHEIPPPPTDLPPPLPALQAQTKPLPQIVIHGALEETAKKTTHNLPNEKEKVGLHPNSTLVVRTTLQSKKLLNNQLNNQSNKQPDNPQTITKIPTQEVIKPKPAISVPLNTTQNLPKPEPVDIIPNPKSAKSVKDVHEDPVEQLLDDLIETKPVPIIDDRFKNLLDETMRIHKMNFAKNNPDFQDFSPQITTSPMSQKTISLEGSEEEEIKREDEWVEMPIRSRREKKQNLFSFFCCCNASASQPDSDSEDELLRPDNNPDLNKFKTRNTYQPDSDSEDATDKFSTRNKYGRR